MPDISIARRDGHAVVLDAGGQAHTAGQLAQTVHLLEGQQQAAPPEMRPFWTPAIAWRRAVLAALDAMEAGDAQSGE